MTNKYQFLADYHTKAARFISRILIAVVLTLHFSPAMAEGSKDLYPQSYQATYGLNSGDLDWRCRAMLVSASSAVDRPFSTRGTFRVYAKAGEHLRFASSALNSATTADCTGSIVWRAPNGESGTIANNSEGGYIANRDQEVEGPNYGAFNGGYDAYKIDVTAATEGIWEVEFHGKDDVQTDVPYGEVKNIYDFNSPHSTLVNPSMTSVNEGGNTIRGNTINYQESWHTNVWVENEEINTPGTGKTYDIRKGDNYNGANVSNVFISAFDITVTDASDMNVIEGRMYTNVLNLAAWGPKQTTSRWYGTLYVLNHNGSVAVFTPNGMCGDNVSLFANNKGIISDGMPSYKSASSLTTHDPRTTDVVSQKTDADGKKVDVYEDVTYKIFFNKPSSDLPTVATKCVYGSSISKTWLRKENVDSDPKITNFNVVGKGGTEGGSSEKGSNIVFTAPMQGIYSIQLKFNSSRYSSRTLTGYFFDGDNVVEWDGKDGKGNSVPTGQKLTASGSFTFSEFHFPLYDVARNVGGLSINIKDATASNNLTKTIYWDDTDVKNTTTSYSSGVASTDLAAGNGDAAVEKTSGAESPNHAWGKTFIYKRGATTYSLSDKRGEDVAIDTWAFQSTTASKTVTLREEKLDIALTAATGGTECAAIGDDVSYSLEVTNVASTNTIADAKGAKLGLITYDADGNRLDGFTISSITTTAAASDAYVLSPSDGTIFVKNGKTATFTVVGSFSSAVAHKTISVKAYVMHPAGLFESDANNADDPTDPIEEYEGVTNNNFQDLPTQTFITNNSPVANDDSYSLIESQTLVGNVLDNDVDPDGDPLKVSRFWVDGDEYQAGETASVNEGSRDAYYTVGSITVAKDGTLTFIATNLFAESSGFSITYEVEEEYTADTSAKCPDPEAQPAEANVNISYGLNYAPDIEPTTFNIKGRKNPVKIPILIFDRDNDPLTLSLSGTDASKFRFDYSGNDTTLYYVGGPLKEDATYHINVSAYDGSVKTSEAVTVNVSKIATPYFKHDAPLWLGVPQCTDRNAATRYDAVRTALILDEDVAIPQDIKIVAKKNGAQVDNHFAFFDGQLYFVWNYTTAGTRNNNIPYVLTVSFTDSEGLDWTINLEVNVNCSGTYGEVTTDASAVDGYYGSTIADLITYHAYYTPNNSTSKTDITSKGPWTFSEDGIPYQLTDILPAGSHTLKLAYSPRDQNAAFADKDNIVQTVSFTINKRNVTITSDSKTRVYNKEPLEAKSVTTTAFTSVSDGNGFIGDEGVVCDNFAYIIEVGSKPNDFTCEAKDNTDLSNYNVITKSGTLTVTKRVVDLSEIEISAPNCTYNGKPQTPTIKLIVDGKVVTPSAYDVTFSDNVNAGTATIVIKDKGVNKNYSIPDYTGHFTIAQREVKLDWGTTSFIYNAREQSVKATLSNVIDGDVVKVSSYEDNVKTDVGTYFAKALTLSNANYKLPKGNGTYWYIETLDLDDYTITLAQKEFTYDATAKEPKVTITATVDGEKVTIPSTEYIVAYYQNVNASTTAPTVTITDAADGNYNLAEKSVTFIINTAELQVVWDYTAPFTYDGTVKRVAVKEFTGLQGADVIESDDIIYSGKTSATAANNADVPSYSASVSINSINYTLDAATTSLTWKINKAEIDPYVTYSNDFTFNGKAQKPTDVVVMTAEGGETLLEGTDFEITWPTETTTAGDKSFNIKSLDASNYSFDVDKVYTIKKKPVSLTWVGDSEYSYDATEKSVSATIATAAAGYPCTPVLSNAAKTNAGTYQAKATLSDADNYEFDAASVTTFDWVIKQSALTAEWDGVSEFTYDGKSKSVSVKLSPIYGSDVCNPVGKGTLSATDADSYTYTVTGVSNSNYVLSPATQELAWTIKKKSTTATVTVSPAEAAYDGTTHTPIVTVTDADDNVIALSEYTATWSGTLKDADTYTVTVVSNDVNYSFAEATATYTIKKRNVTLTSATDSKSYDGTALTNSKVSVSGEGFTTGEGVASFNVTGSITNVGSVDNDFTYTLKTNTKASNYDITTKAGTLEVTKAVGTQSATLDVTVFTYDATVHHPAVTVKVGSLTVPSTEYTVEYPTDCVNASDDELNVTIKNVEGGNFDITTAVLTFKINKAAANIVWDNDSFPYDGNAKTVTPSVGNPVKAEDAFTFTYAAGSVTTASEAGTYNATVSDLGNSNYSIASGASHDWTIVKKSVVAKVTITDEVEHTYDGTDYTPAVKVTDADGNVIPSSEYTVTYTPATDLKNVGQKTVTVSSNGINYQFSNTPSAKYEIKKRSVTLTSASGSKTYDGTPLTNSNVSVSDEGFTTGEGVASFNVTGTITNVGSVDNDFTYTLKTNTKASNYDITTKAGTLEVTKAVGTQSATLDVTVFTYDATVHHPAVTVKVGSLTVPSTEYTVEYPTDCVNASDDELNVTIKNVEGGNFDITTAVLTFKINKAAANIVWDNDSFPYDGNAKTVTPSVGNPVKAEDAFTFTYAAGSVTTASEAGTYNATVSDLGNSNYSIASGASHDWTIVKKSVVAKVTITDEVEHTYDGTDYTPAVKVTDADGNVIPSSEYTVTYTPATDLKNVGQKTVTVSSNGINYQFSNTPSAKYEIKKRSVTLTSATDSKSYDGTALTNSKVSISGDGFATGEGATFSVTGTQTEVGASDNVFSYSLISGTNAANYTIIKKVGRLFVTAKSIDVTISLSDDDFVYDGKIHKPTTVTVTDADGNVIDAEEYTETYTTNDDLINAGPKYVRVISNGKNFTFNSVKSATYTIKKRSVTLTAASDSKIYDGTPLTNSNVYVGGDGFVEGEGATYVVDGSQTNCGGSANKFLYTLSAGTLASNYDITENYGWLEVTARETAVYIVLDKTTALYNGAAHVISCKAFDVEGNEIAADQYAPFYSTTDLTNAGDIEVQITPKTFNYVFTGISSATYTIAKRKVKISSADATKTYDGSPLTSKDVILSGDGFVTGEGATYIFSGSQTNVGSSANTFTYTLNANTKDSNYEITTTDGTLTVNAKVLDASKIDILTSDVVYNGEAQEPAFSVKIEGEVVSADQYELSFSNNVNVGTATVTVKPSATSNYSFVDKSETFNITAATLTVTGSTVLDRVYDGTKNVSVAVGTVNGIMPADAGNVSVSATATLTSADAADNKAVTIVYTINGSAAANYVIATDDTKTVNITPKEVTLSWSAIELTYNGSEQSVSANVTSLVSGDVCTVTSYSNNSATEVGSYTATATALSNSNYKLPADASHAWKIVAKKINVRVVLDPADPQFKYNGQDQFANFYVVDEDDNRIPASEYTAQYKNSNSAHENDIKNVGLIEVSVISNGKNYTFNDVESGYYLINRRYITALSGSASKVYDGSALTEESVTIGGDMFVDGEGFDFNCTGSQTEVGSSDNTFTYTAKAGTNADNYYIVPSYGTLTVKSKELTDVTCDLTPSTFTYDGTAHEPAVSLKSGDVTIPASEYSVTYSDNTNAGTGKVTVTNVDGGNYTVPTKDFTFTISPKAVTLTSADGEKVYDGTPLKKESVTAVGVIAGESFDYSDFASITEVGSVENTFTYAAHEGTLATNYDVIATYGTLTVKSKELTDVTCDLTPSTFTYDGTAHEPAVSLKSGDVTIPTSEYRVTYSDNTNAGTGKVTVTNVDGGNYTVPTKVFSFTIEQRVATLSWSATSLTYNGSEQVVTANVTNLVASDACDVTSYTGNAATTVGNYTATATALSNDNYKLPADASHSWKIVAQAIDPSALDIETYNVTYNGLDQTPEFVVTLNGVTLDKSEYVYSYINNRNAGQATVSIEPSADSNYSFVSVSKQFTIEPATLTVSGSVVSDKEYDGTLSMNVTVGTVSGIQNGEDITLTAVATVTTKDVAANKPVNVVYTIVGATSANYVIANETLSADINKRQITIESATASKTYDGLPLTAETVNVTSGSFAAGEGFSYDNFSSITTAQTVDNEFQYHAKTGTDLNNYNVTVNYGTLTISPASSTDQVISYVASFVYTGEEIEPEVNIIIGGDAIDKSEFSVSYSNNLNVGTATISVSNVDGGNYVIDDATRTFQITPAALTVSGTTVDDRPYDGTTTVSVSPGTLQGLKKSDTLVLSASAVALSKDAANDIPVTVTYTIEGDKKDNYTIDADNSFSVNITPAALTLTSATDSKTYDTTPLTNHNVEAVGFVAGENFSYNVFGSQTNVGSSKNTFSYSADAATIESNYDVTKVEGDLIVNAAKGDATSQKVTLSADVFTYNGNQQRPDVTVTINGLTVPASEYTINWPVNTTDASVDALEVTIVDNEGGNFIVANDGFSFFINPVDITIESADATKVYDRTPLSKEQVNVTSGAFVAGEGFTYDNFASITEVGKVDNTFDYHADAATKLSNYNVTVNYGELSITKMSFNVSDIIASFDQDSYVYTGLPIEPVVELKVGDLVIPASEYVISFENNINVGTAKVKVTNATDGNYVIPDCEFSFTIIPATLTVSGTTLDDKAYDGNTDVTVNVGNLEGVKASDVLTVTATAVAASKDAADGVEVTISYELTGAAKDNYTLADDNSLSINITPRAVTFTSETDTKVYDGTALQNENVNVDNIVSGEAFTFSNFASITEVGEVDNTFDYAPQTGTLASNYDVHAVYGKLSITSKVIDATDINCEFESLDYTYNGHEFKPLVTLRLTDGTEIPASEFSVTYADNIDAGVNTAKAQISNVDGGNYTLPAVEFTFSIAQREVTLTWSDTELVYNGLEQGPALTIGEIQTREVAGVEVADVVNATITGDKQVNVGGYTAEVLSLDNANYILPAVTTQDWKIKTQEIAPDAIQIITASVPYNGNYQEPAFEVTINGVTLNAAEYELSFSNNRNVGDNTAIVTVTPSATSNYDFADKSEHFSITPLTLTVSGTTVSDKVYDGDAEMPVAAGSLVGLVSGDDVTLSATAEAADKNVAADAKEVNVTYSLSGADSGNYLISGESLSAYITKREVTLTSADAEKTFDNTPLKSEVVNVTAGSIVSGEGFVFSNFASRIVAGSEPNTFDYVADANTIADNYEVAVFYGTLTVNPASSADQNIALERTTYEYTGEPVQPKVIITIGGVEIAETEYDVVFSNNTNVGEATVSITNHEGGNYVIEAASTTFTITPATLTVSGTTLDDKAYDGNTDVTVNVGNLEGVKASDVLTVTATAVAASKDAADGVEVTISYELTGAAKDNYTLADDNSLSINITPRAVTFTSETDTKVYDGTALQNENVNVDNIVSGEAFTFSNFASITEVGEVDNTFDYAPQTGTLASNYDVHAVYGKLSITSKVIDATDINCEFESLDYTYNGHEFKPLVTLRLTDGTEIPASEFSVTYADNIDAGVNTAKAQISNVDGGNYTLPAVEFTFSIAQREVTLTWSDTELVYNGLEQGPALTIGEIQTRDVDGVEVTDVVNATITGDKQVNVGGYTAEVLSLDNANYILPASTTQDWKISKASLSDDITIEVIDNNLVYNAKPQEAEFVLRNTDGSIIPASEYVVTYENNVDASDNAKIIVTNAEGGNLVVPTISTTFTIKPAPLTISVSNVTTTKQYDGNNATTFDSSVEGVIEGTDPLYEVNVNFDDANVGTGKTITATYSVANTNYVLTTNSEVVTTSGEITPIALTVNGTIVDNKVFDGNVSANVSTIGTLNGVILGQDVTIATAEASFADKNVGSSKPVTVKFTLAGADAANYSIDDVTLSADITTLALTVSGAAVDSKVYDATTAATISNVGTLNGVTADMDVQVAAAVASFADKNVGLAKPVTVTFTLSGADAANCSVADATLSADITPKALTVSGAISSSKKFDNTTMAKLAYYGSLIGVIYEDDVTIDTVATVATFTDALPGSGKVVNVVFALTGADAANYTVENVTLTDGVIIALERDKSMYDFFAPANTVYDGTPKVAVVTGPGQITLFYSSDNGVTWSTDAPVDVDHYIVKINVAADEEYEAAEITDDSWIFDVTKGQQDAPALAGKPTSRPSADDGQIIGLTTDMEIRLDGQSTYQKVTNTELLFAAGTYHVRYVETDNYYASKETDVTIKPGDKLDRVIEDYTVTLPEYLGYNGKPKEATVEGPGVITVYYKQAGGTWTTSKPVDMGTYFVKFTVDEDIDYNSAEFVDGAWTFTITREPLVIDGFVLTANGYCPGSEGVVKFNIVTGDPVEVRFAVIDTTAAVNSPITESEYQELTSDSEFTFTMPKATEGKRTLQVQFRESDGLTSEVYSLKINVNLTNEYLTDIWYDVVSIINKVDLNKPEDLTPRFQAYKWYRDGEELAGQTKPYVQQVGGLQGTYYAQVTTTDALGAETLYTCPKTWDSGNKSLTLRVYPNPVITIANVELSQNDGNDHDISIVDNKGLTLYRGTFNGATTSVNMSSYEAGYYIIIVDNLKANVVKK